MNLKERNMIFRVDQALNVVPGAYLGGGSQTTTVGGVVNFAADMMEVRKHCSAALEALFDGALTKAERDANFNAAIEEAEAFINSRKATDWKNR